MRILRCSKCSRDLAENLFYRKRKIRRGRDYWCVECTKKAQAPYRQRNSERIVKRVTEWVKNNKDRANANRRAFYRRNREAYSMYHKLLWAVDEGYRKQQVVALRSQRSRLTDNYVAQTFGGFRRVSSLPRELLDAQRLRVVIRRMLYGGDPDGAANWYLIGEIERTARENS